jgi:hypothetical protein
LISFREGVGHCIDGNSMCQYSQHASQHAKQVSTFSFLIINYNTVKQDETEKGEMQFREALVSLLQSLLVNTANDNTDKVRLLYLHDLTISLIPRVS